jgi:hypothetical protein
MSTHHGKDGIVKIGATGGTDVIGELTDFTYEESVQTSDDGAKGDDYETHLTGRKSWSGSASANFDSGDTNGQNALAVGASVVLNLYPIGAASATKYKSGTATVTKRSVSAPLDNKVSIAFDFKGNGALSDATVGA